MNGMRLPHALAPRALVLVLIASACTGRGDEKRIDTSSAEPTSQAIVQPLPTTTTDTTRPATRIADTLWLFGPTPEQDAIRASTTENLLVRQFGAANVKDDSLSGGEGEMVAGTVLFPTDSLRRVEIFWDDSAPAHTRISMLRVNGSRSLWMVAPGVTLGTSLADLETINHGPFTLSGFGWDYGGTVTSWRGGTLDTLWTGAGGKTLGGRVGVRMTYAKGTPESVLTRVQGDRDFASSLPAMHAANPVIAELYVTPR
jgi:hypothetical protein